MNMKTEIEKPVSTTPTPWTAGGVGQIFDIYGNEIAVCKNYGAGIVPAGYVCPWHQYEANAELICRAVNMHADLVEELKAVCTHAETAWRVNGDDPPCPWTEKARALLGRLDHK